MQKYRDLSSVMPRDFDAQAWTAFIQQNSNLLSCSKRPQPTTERLESPMDHSGIERLHQLLSESSTPRDLPSITRPESPTQSPLPLLSRVSTPVGYQTQSQPVRRSGSDAPPRPSSRTSTQEIAIHCDSEGLDSIRLWQWGGYLGADTPKKSQGLQGKMPRKRRHEYREATWFTASCSQYCCFSPHSPSYSYKSHLPGFQRRAHSSSNTHFTPFY